MADLPRISAALIPNAEQALNWLTERTGLNRTDVINRALQIYHFTEGAVASGARVQIVHPDGTVEGVRVL